MTRDGAGAEGFQEQGFLQERCLCRTETAERMQVVVAEGALVQGTLWSAPEGERTG